MPNYQVTVGDKKYRVTARDENEAWSMANQHAEGRAAKRAELTERYAAEDEASGLTDPTHGMSWGSKALANLGAGASDWMIGAKQLVGQASAEDVAEKERIDQHLASKTRGGKLLQLTGNVAPAIAGAIPFGAAAATVKGGALLGAGMGALSPTSDTNLLRGKAVNTALGGALGGAANKLIPMVAPAARRVAGAVTQGARRLTEGGRQRLAEDAFKQQINDPQAALALLRGHRDVPGAAPTTAQILNDPAMLATEHRLANTGGEASQALLGRRMDSNAARNTLLQQELGGNVAALENEASQFAQSAKPQLFDNAFNQRPVIGELTRLQNQANSPSAKAALESIKESVRAALKSNNPLEQLHQVRMYQIDDAMSRLGQSDAKLAGAMRRELQSVKAALDLALDKSTNGQWSKFLEGYSTRATARDQGRAGASLLETIAEKAAPDNAGNPMLGGRRTQLRGEVGAVDDFGKPKYSAGGARAIEDVNQSLNVEARTANVRPAGSATASNMARGAAEANDALLRPLTGQTDPGWLARAAKGVGGSGAGATLGMLTGGGPGAIAGGIVGGVASDALAAGTQGRALDLARRLFQMHLDPQQAIQVLQQAVAARQMTTQQAQSILKILMQKAGQVAAPFSTGTQISVPQHAGQSLADMLNRN